MLQKTLEIKFEGTYLSCKKCLKNFHLSLGITADDLNEDNALSTVLYFFAKKAANFLFMQVDISKMS